MERTNIKIKKSLKYSIADATFYSIMVGFGESFLSTFAIFLKASNIQLGLLGSLPQTLGSLFQLLSNRLIKFFDSRKRFVCIGALLQGLMYLPIALVFYFGALKLSYLIAFACLYWIFGMIIGPAWNSWMGDLVPEKERGAYFGRRNMIAGFASFVALLIGGYILQHFSADAKTEYAGFAIILGIALISRVVSFIYLTRKYEPKYRIAEEAQFSFVDFVKQARFRNYGRFVIYLSLMNFAVYLAAPFFAAYMLYDLKLDYMTFTIINAAAIITKHLSMPVWGRMSDQFGRKKILSLTGFLVPFIPLLWLFSENVVYLILIQFYAGFIWAGFEIASFSFVFDTTTPEKRATCVAYYNVLNGIALFIGAIAGSIIVKYNSVFWSKYLLVFLISFILRYAVSFIFVPKLKEVRQVEHITHKDLLIKIITTMPTMGLVYDLISFRKK